MNGALDLADAVRKACLVAALKAYDDAGLQGLCQEGRWECAVDAIRGLDLESLLKASEARTADPGIQHDQPRAASKEAR